MPSPRPLTASPLVVAASPSTLEYSAHAQKLGAARGLDSWRRPEGSRPLETRMSGRHDVYRHWYIYACVPVPVHLNLNLIPKGMGFFRLHDAVARSRTEMKSSPGSTTGVNSCRNDLLRYDIFSGRRIQGYKRKRG